MSMLSPIEKIISGGQTGADIAALDAAMDYGVPHGGWIPKGRRTEDGSLSDRYLLKETNNIGYPQRTILNILDSDGTLIFSHGELAGRSAFTRDMAKKHSRPCLHINLSEISEYQAVEIIRDWIEVKGIKVLNVSGPKHSEDPFIYDVVNNIVKSVLYPPPESFPRPYPRTVHKAVDRLVSTLSLKEKTHIAHMAKEDLSALPPTVGRYIRDHFGLGWGNAELLASCRSVSGQDDLTEASAVNVIIEALWEELRHTHGLKLIK